MKKYNIGRGIIIVVVLCLLAAGSLTGYNYYKGQRLAKELYKLMENYDAAVRENREEYNAIVKKMENNPGSGSLDRELQNMKTQDKVEECNLKINQFNETHQVTLDMWVDIFMDEQFADTTKSILISEYIKYNEDFVQDVESFYRLLDSEKVSDGVKDDLLYVLSPQTGQQRQKLIGYHKDIMKNATETFDFITKAKSMMGCADLGESLEILNYFLESSNSSKCSEGQRLGAAVVKCSYMEVVDGYSQEEKKVCADILKAGFSKELEKEYIGVWKDILLAVSKLKREEDLNWLADTVEDLQRNTDCGYETAFDTIFYPDMVDMAVSWVKENPSLENLTNAIGIINCALTMESFQNGYIDWETILLYMQTAINRCSQKEQLPMLAKVKECDFMTLKWACEKDIDGDGLADVETFAGTAEEYKEADYKIAFGNGDILSYTHEYEEGQTPMSGYVLKYADINGDNRSEIILFIRPSVLGNYKSSVEINSIEAGLMGSSQGISKENDSLWINDVRGFVVFEKKAGSNVYTPLLTKDGESMVTDIYEVSGTRVDFDKVLEQLDMGD